MDPIPLDAENLLLRGCVLRCLYLPLPPFPPSFHFFPFLFFPSFPFFDLSFRLISSLNQRNTEWALGVVVYTGHETKSMLNSKRAPSKKSQLEREMNKMVLWLIALLLIICIICGVGTSCQYFFFLSYFIRFSFHSFLISFISHFIHF